MSDNIRLFYRISNFYRISSNNFILWKNNFFQNQRCQDYTIKILLVLFFTKVPVTTILIWSSELF